METKQNNGNQQSEIQVFVEAEDTMDLRNTSIDFMTIVEPGGDPCKGLYLSIIQDAINDYLWFGIKNKYKVVQVDEFLEAYNYLYISRSTDRTTWFAISPFLDEPDAVSEVSLSESQLKLMCFDVHFDLTKLSNRIKMSYLLEFLKEKRAELVEENYPRLLRKINSSKKKYYRTKSKNYKTVNLDKSFVTNTLVAPRESDIVSLYFGDLDETVS
jgi:hypothetical protein